MKHTAARAAASLLMPLCLILSLCTASTGAAENLPVGQWRVHTAFQGGSTDAIFPVGQKLFFLSGINMHSYDLSTQEYVTYSTDNVMGDVFVSDAWHNPDGRYILTAYKSGHLDLLRYDGTAANIPAIRDAGIVGNRDIRAVAFRGDTAYVATDFGLVVVDGARGRVIESGQYRGGVSSIGAPLPSGGPKTLAMVGESLLAVFDDGFIYESKPADGSLTYRDAAKFVRVGMLDASQIMPTDGGKAFYAVMNVSSSNRPFRVEMPISISPDGTVKSTPLGSILKQPLWKDPADGEIYSQLGDGRLIRLAGTGVTAVGTFPEETGTSFSALTTTGGGATAWLSTGKGISSVDFNPADGTPQVSFGPFAPPLPGVINVSILTPSPDGERVLVGTRSSSFDFYSASGAAADPLNIERKSSGYGLYTPGFIDIIEDGEVEPLRYDCTLLSMKNGAGSSYSTVTTARYGNVMSSPQGMAINPAEPSHLWVATQNEGLYRIDLSKGETDALFSGCDSPAKEAVTMNYLYDNIPVSGFNRASIMDCKFDSEGNLWVLSLNDEYGADKTDFATTQLCMLPAALTREPMEKITKDKWINRKSDGTPLIPVTSAFTFDGQLVMNPVSGTMTIIPARWGGRLILYRFNGTPGNVDNHSYVILDKLTDQDSNVLTGYNVVTVVEDKSGRLLAPLGDGFVLISNPRTFDPTRDAVRRLKVARNDGTGTADYLLNQVVVSGLSFDGAGRLWASTEGSGVSVISANYDEVLQQFTADNSPLPTNYISAILTDPLSNRVYMGSKYGLIEYASDQAPGAEDYSEVRVYPNPVRPEYRGELTVDGLMEDTLVKIADATGTVINSGISTGGLYRWNLRDASGRRPLSGVYYVITSQRGEGGNKGRVAAKFLLVN